MKPIRTAAWLLAASMAASALADFSGPAPLAWRWIQPTAVVPGGSLAATGELIYAAVGNRMYAIERDSGNQRWRYPSGEPVAGNFRSGLLLAGDLVVGIADNKTMYAVEASSGNLKWTYNLEENLVGTPVIAGPYVVFAAGGALNAVKLSDGQSAWQSPQRIFDGIQGGLSAYLDNVLFFTGLGELWSLNIGSQNLNWKRRFSRVEGNVRPVVFGDSIFINTGTFVVSLRALNGQPRFEMDTRMNLTRNPAVNENGFAVMSLEGQVMTYDLNGRKTMDKPVELEAAPANDPVLVNKMLAVGTTNGAVNLVDPASGKLVWSYTIPLVTRAKTTGEANSPYFIQPATAPLVSGTSMIIAARDGSILSFDAVNGVDATPPEVTQVFPVPGEVGAGRPPMEVYFTIRDEATGVNPSSIKVTVGGRELKHRYTRDGFIIIAFEQGAGATGNAPLGDGRQVLKVTASDWLGNPVSKEFGIRIDSSAAPFGRPRRPEGSGTAGGAGGPGSGGREGG